MHQRPGTGQAAAPAIGVLGATAQGLQAPPASHAQPAGATANATRLLSEEPLPRVGCPERYASLPGTRTYLFKTPAASLP